MSVLSGPIMALCLLNTVNINILWEQRGVSSSLLCKPVYNWELQATHIYVSTIIDDGSVTKDWVDVFSERPVVVLERDAK